MGFFFFYFMGPMYWMHFFCCNIFICFSHVILNDMWDSLSKLRSVAETSYPLVNSNTIILLRLRIFFPPTTTTKPKPHNGVPLQSCLD